MAIYIGKQITTVEKPKPIERKAVNFSELRSSLNSSEIKVNVASTPVRVERKEPEETHNLSMKEQILKNKSSDFLLDMFTLDD